MALEEKGLKRGDFYQYAGIKSQSLINWEKRSSVPAADTAIKMADYLKVSVRWLILGEEDGLSNEEIGLLDKYRQIEHQKDKDEIMSIILLKIESQKKGVSLSNSETA